MKIYGVSTVAFGVDLCVHCGRRRVEVGVFVAVFEMVGSG